MKNIFVKSKLLHEQLPFLSQSVRTSSPHKTWQRVRRDFEGGRTNRPDIQLFILQFLAFLLPLQWLIHEDTQSNGLHELGCLHSVRNEACFVFRSPGVEPRYRRILYILLSSQFLQSGIAAQR